MAILLIIRSRFEKPGNVLGELQSAPKSRQVEQQHIQVLQKSHGAAYKARTQTEAIMHEPHADPHQAHGLLQTHDTIFSLGQYPDLPSKYKLNKLLGEGAFSSVYKGTNTETDETVAIKIINKLNLTPKQLNNIHNEIHIMNTLSNAGNHPNVLRLIELFDQPDNCFLILEYCDGVEIFNKIIDYTYFSEQLARHVFLQLVDAIQFLHQHYVVHRDIKPENLLFQQIPLSTRSDSEFRKALRASDDALKQDEGCFVPGVGGGGIGTVKLADFGLAKLLRVDPKGSAGTGPSNLKTPCGTAGYTAPEVIHCGVERKRRFDSSTSKSNYYLKAVDIWSLGCLLYTMLCGFPPFYDENHDVLTHKIITADYVFLEPWWDEISDDAKDLVSRMLVVNPELRITIDEIYNHPWMADAVRVQNLSYFPEQRRSLSTTTLRGMGAPKRVTSVSPSAGGGLVSPGIAIKQVFSNPAMLHVNLRLLAQIQGDSNDVDPREVKFDGTTRFSMRSKNHLPKTPNAMRKVNFNDVFDAGVDDNEFDDSDEEEEEDDDDVGDLEDDFEFGEQLELKYLSISSTSSTDSLKLMNDDDTRSLSIISGINGDYKFTLNMNDLNLLRRRLSTKSGHHT